MRVVHEAATITNVPALLDVAKASAVNTAQLCVAWFWAEHLQHPQHKNNQCNVGSAKVGKHPPELFCFDPHGQPTRAGV
jgi:hypothetical protein